MSTGSLTAQRRLPLQQLTMFSYSIRNFILIGAGADPGHYASAYAADMYDLVQRFSGAYTLLRLLCQLRTCTCVLQAAP